jgi:hypothetical protein
MKSLANQKLTLDVAQNMDRRRTIGTEHRARRGNYITDGPKHPLAVTQSELDANEKNIQFEWETHH